MASCLKYNYIDQEREEKASQHGRVSNWKTLGVKGKGFQSKPATTGRVWGGKTPRQNNNLKEKKKTGGP